MDKPEIVGRFNYVSVKPDLFDIMFKPFDSPIYVVVARNLSRQQMDDLRSELNFSLDETYREINKDNPNKP